MNAKDLIFKVRRLLEGQGYALERIPKYGGTEYVLRKDGDRITLWLEEGQATSRVLYLSDYAWVLLPRNEPIIVVGGPELEPKVVTISELVRLIRMRYKYLGTSP